MNSVAVIASVPLRVGPGFGSVPAVLPLASRAPGSGPGGRSAGLGLADALDGPVVGLSADACVLQANQAAWRLLDGGSIRVDGGRFAPAVDGPAHAWRMALRSALAGVHTLLRLRPPGEPVALLIGPGAQPEVPVVVRIGIAGDGGRPALVAYARAIDLTPQETRVLVALAAGRSAEAVARAHGVALSTIRTQIRAVLSKAGVHGVRELLVEVSRLPW
jgi:DNA-binding CsgD family transcriptional regulator